MRTWKVAQLTVSLLLIGILITACEGEKPNIHDQRALVVSESILDGPNPVVPGLDKIEEAERSYTTDHLVGHWKFDEGSGTAVSDASNYGNDGVIYGAEWTEGVIGSALEFDGGKYDYVQISTDGGSPPAHLRDLGKGSISLWFNCYHIPLDKGILPMFYYGSHDSCANMFDAANQGLIVEVGHSPVHAQSKYLYFTLWANGCAFPSCCFNSEQIINEREWYHFVAVVGPDYNTGFLNGVEMVGRHYNFGTAFYSQFFADAVDHGALWIGRGFWDATAVHFDGKIDDVRIYDIPLNSQEVLEIYNEGQTQR